MFGNVFVQLIHRPMRTKNLLYKNPNTAYRIPDTSGQHRLSSSFFASFPPLSVSLHLAEVLELQHLDVAGLVELDDALLTVYGEERARLLPVLPDDDLDLVAALGGHRAQVLGRDVDGARLVGQEDGAHARVHAAHHADLPAQPGVRVRVLDLDLYVWRIPILQGEGVSE